MSTIVDLLIKTFGKDSVLTREEAALRVASNWRQKGHLDCLALLRPKTTSEVCEMLRTCNDLDLPVVPHGGLTNVVGGTITKPNEIALSLSLIHISEPTRLLSISYAVFCLKKKNK